MQYITTILSALLLLAIFVAILVLAYFVTTQLGKRYTGKGSTASGYIKIMDRAMLGPDRSVVLVKVADKLLLLGVTPQHIETLCEVDEELLPQQTEGIRMEDTPFSNLLSQVIKKNWGGRGNEATTQQDKQLGGQKGDEPNNGEK